jgi:hypothetical protein
MTWRQVADELPGFTASTLANLAEGPLIGFPTEMILTQWLCRAARELRARLRALTHGRFLRGFYTS